MPHALDSCGDPHRCLHGFRDQAVGVGFFEDSFGPGGILLVLFEVDFLTHDMNFWIRNYDLSPDGQRFLMVQSEEEPPPPTKIKIVLNWFDELERLVP